MHDIFHLGISSIFWIILIAIGAGLLLIINKRKSMSGSETPLDILKRRYARGEIDRTQYERMKKELG